MKKITIIAAVAALACAAGLARAQDYPNAPFHLISGFPAGSTADISARVVGAKMGQILGQQLVVENRTGASSSIGAALVARAPKDGYMLFVASAANMVNAAMNASMSFDIMKDFAPIALITSTPTVLVVRPDLGVKSVTELIALAKAKPDTITFGTTGPGTIQRIATEYFAGIAGVKLVHVPYKGANETTTAILSGEIDMTINGMSNILPHIGEGKLKALAVSTVTRNPLAPDVPTMQEAGVPGYSSQGAFGLFAPAGTPKDIIAKIHADTAAVLAQPDVKKALEARSFVIGGAGPAEFEKFIADEHVKWQKVIKEADIKIN